MDRPNILLIQSDQHRWDCAGFAGNPDVRTPNLDALAAYGVWFDQAICQSTRCVPSRATLMTGRYPAAHGVRDNETGLAPGTPNVVRVLREAGYTTAAIGKMHFRPARADHGFDLVRLAEQDPPGRFEDDYHPWLAGRGLRDEVDEWDQVDRNAAPEAYRLSFGAMPSALPAEAHSTNWIGDEAVRFLQTVKPPFFLWASFIKPHHPFDPPAPWHRMYHPKLLALPGGFRLPVRRDDLVEGAHFDLRGMTEARFRQVLSFYYANISHVDQQIGRILATLAARGHTSNVIVYCSDHGDYMGQHGLILKDGRWPYDALIRVPLIISGVAGQRQGARDPAPAELTDVAPTLLDAAGIRVPDEIQGRSLMQRLRNGGAPLRGAAFCEDGDARVARDANYKLVASVEGTPLALFDLTADPHEFDNRVGQARIAKEQARLLRHLQRIRN